MDPRLEKALEFSNYADTLQNQKQILLHQFKENNHYYFNGGAFEVTAELINFCKLMQDLDKPLVVLDTNQTPIEVEDISAFIQGLVNVYVQATNDYVVQYNKIKKARNIESLLDL